MRRLRSHPSPSNTSPSPHTTDVVDDPTADQEPIADQASPVVSQRTDSTTQPDPPPNSETDAAQSSDPHGTVTTLTIPTPIIDTRLLLVGVTKKTLVHSFT